jgi:uncharacterized membrane protein YdbT with pleckstrin-like domain
VARFCSLAPVPYSKDLLSADEQVLLEFKPHWLAVVKEILVTVAYLVIIALLSDGGWNGWVFTILTALWAWVAIGGYLRWSTTDHVLTNHRFIYTSGALRKTGYEFPLEVINDVAFSQSLWERPFHVGSLALESAGTKGTSVLRNIPNPEDVKSAISDARRRRAEMIGHGTTPATSIPAQSTAEQLAVLARLLDEGKLTQAEYETEKQRLLGA